MNPTFLISSPVTYEEKIAIQSLFYDNIWAVARYPKESVRIVDTIWNSPTAEALLLQAHDSTGLLVGAVSVSLPAIVGAAKRGWMLAPKHLQISNKVRNLDFIAVDRHYRNNKIAAALLGELEEMLRKQGVVVLFGGVEDDLNEQLLRTFFRSLNYQVTEELPPFFGLDWRTEIVAQRLSRRVNPQNFHVYKRL